MSGDALNDLALLIKSVVRCMLGARGRQLDKWPLGTLESRRRTFQFSISTPQIQFPL